MSGWYGHTIEVNIQKKIKTPSYDGKLGFIDTILSEEISHLERKMTYIGSQISYQIALSSQTFQRRAITELDAVDTGRLRDSIRITGNSLISYVGTDLYYAEDVHDIGIKGSGSLNVKWPNGVGPRKWTEVSASNVANSIDGIVEGVLNKNF